jgi:hypothetical protein
MSPTAAAASYDSQGHGGGIWPHLHMGKVTLFYFFPPVL